MAAKEKENFPEKALLSFSHLCGSFVATEAQGTDTACYNQRQVRSASRFWHKNGRWAPNIPQPTLRRRIYTCVSLAKRNVSA
jgi:hypothetical protein